MSIEEGGRGGRGYRGGRGRGSGQRGGQRGGRGGRRGGGRGRGRDNQVGDNNADKTEQSMENQHHVTQENDGRGGGREGSRGGRGRRGRGGGGGGGGRDGRGRGGRDPSPTGDVKNDPKTEQGDQSNDQKKSKSDNIQKGRGGDGNRGGGKGGKGRGKGGRNNKHKDDKKDQHVVTSQKKEDSQKVENKNKSKQKDKNQKSDKKKDNPPLTPSIPPSQPQQTSDINYCRGQTITVLHVAEKPSIAQAIATALCKGKSNYRSKSLPVHEFDDPPFPKAPHASLCKHKVTSVAGHVFSVDFPQKFASWDSTDPAELFKAPVQRKPTKGGTVKHLSDEGKGVDFIVVRNTTPYISTWCEQHSFQNKSHMSHCRLLCPSCGLTVIVRVRISPSRY